MGEAFVSGGGQQVWRSLVAAGIKAGLRKAFCGAQKMNRIAPGMILIWARGLELRGGCSSLKARRWTSKVADQRHGFVAVETSRQRFGRRGLRQGLLPIEQGKDALPSGFGGGTEPAEVADALKAFWQDVLEETPKELRSGEGKHAPLLVQAVFVFKGDLSIFCFDDPL